MWCLSVPLGCAETAKAWDGTACELERAGDVVALGMPVVATPMRYSFRVLLVLLYVAGMFGAPRELSRIERDAWTRLMRFPGMRAQCDLRTWGGPQSRDAHVGVSAAGLAIRARDTTQLGTRCALMGRGAEELRPSPVGHLRTWRPDRHRVAGRARSAQRREAKDESVGPGAPGKGHYQQGGDREEGGVRGGGCATL